MGNSVLDKFLNKNRLVLVFCKDKNSDTYLWQKNELLEFKDSLKQRDVEFIYLFKNGEVDGADFSEAEVNELYRSFKVKPGTFSVHLLDKDGSEKIQDDRPLAAQALLAIIDVMPTRKREQGH